MSLTRGQIITEGLTIAGRTDLAIEARLWLNIFLEKMYRNQDWAWLLKSVTNATLTQGQSLPTDYRVMKTARIAAGGVPGTSPLIQVGPEEFDSLNSSSTTTGNPSKFFVDEVARTFNFWPNPGSGITWNYRYYFLPTLPDPTDPTTDSQTPIWYEDPEILIQEIIQKAMKYNDDDRRQAELQERDQMVVKAKMNSIDMRGGHSKLKLGKNFRRRF